MTPKLYMIPISPPVRSVLITARALGVNLELILVNVPEKEHLKPEFVKVNPQHTVPTRDDDGVIVWDSHAINGYLINKYAKHDTLYPKDYKKSAVVDQRLHFDTGVLFPVARDIARPIFFFGVKRIAQENIDKAQEAYKFLEAFLEGKKWIVGDSVTIADISIISTVSTLNIMVPIKTEDYPNLTAWIQRCEGLSYYEANREGLEVFRSLYESKLKA